MSINVADAFSFFNDYIGPFATIFGTAFGVWQYKRATHLQKIVNDSVKRLYQDSKMAVSYAREKKNFEKLEERCRAIKYSTIQLDILNRNLNRKKIDDEVEKGNLRKEEGEEYALFTHK